MDSRVTVCAMSAYFSQSLGKIEPETEGCKRQGPLINIQDTVSGTFLEFLKLRS